MKLNHFISSFKKNHFIFEIAQKHISTTFNYRLAF